MILIYVPNLTTRIERDDFLKKLFCSLIAMVLAFSLFSSNQTAAKTFSDVPTSNTYYSIIDVMSDSGIINGYSDGTFKPNNTITRAHVAVLISRALDLKAIRPATTFSDVPTTHTYYKDIMALYQAGIVDGSNGKFNPSGSLTRGQLAKILTNAFGLQQQQTTSFKDVPTSNHFNPYIGALAANNITTGYADGTFKPNTTVSRMHFAVFMYRAKYKDFAKMNVHFIDVGQGDSIFIQSPNGKTMLIDGGTASGGDKVVAHLKSLSVSTIDYVVATHPDADHIGGLIDVFAAFKVNNFVHSGKTHTSATFEKLLTAVINEGSTNIEPNTGDTIPLDSTIKIQVLHANKYASDNNDASLVLKLTYGNVSFMLMGDASKEIETQIASKYNVSAQILKAGHHGSNTSSGLSFMQKVNPKAVILSYGEDNSYGHPHSEVLANIKNIGATAYGTAVSGSVIVTTDSVTYSVNAKPMSNSQTPSTPSTPSTPPTTGDPSSGYYVIPGAPTSFGNCTDMRKYYPNGVASSHPAYASKHDRDKDGWACEN